MPKPSTGFIAAILGTAALAVGAMASIFQHYATGARPPTVSVSLDIFGNAYVQDAQQNLIVKGGVITDFGASHGAGVSGSKTTTQGIKEAILSLPNNSGIVLLADGIYSIPQLILDFISQSAVLTIQGNSRDGVIIKQSQNSNSTVFMGFSAPSGTRNSVTIQNLTVDWNLAQNKVLSTQAITLNLADVKYATVQDVIVQNGDLGLDCGYNLTTDPMVHTIQRVTSRNNRVGFWITLNQPQDPYLYWGTLIDCTAESGQAGSGAGSSGFYIEEGNGLQLVRPTVLGANFPLNSVGIFIQRARNTTIESPVISNCNYGIRIGGVVAGPPATSNLLINNPNVSGSKTAGLIAYGGSGTGTPITIQGGVIDIITDLTGGLITFVK